METNIESGSSLENLTLEKDDDTSEEADDDVEDTVEFTKLMRIATRKVHKMSDALVNAKLSIGKEYLYLLSCIIKASTYYIPLSIRNKRSNIVVFHYPCSYAKFQQCRTIRYGQKDF